MTTSLKIDTPGLYVMTPSYKGKRLPGNLSASSYSKRRHGLPNGIETAFESASAAVRVLEKANPGSLSAYRERQHRSPKGIFPDETVQRVMLFGDDLRRRFQQLLAERNQKIRGYLTKHDTEAQIRAIQAELLPPTGRLRAMARQKLNEENAVLEHNKPPLEAELAKGDALDRELVAQLIRITPKPSDVMRRYAEKTGAPISHKSADWLLNLFRASRDPAGYAQEHAWDKMFCELNASEKPGRIYFELDPSLSLDALKTSEPAILEIIPPQKKTK